MKWRAEALLLPLALGACGGEPGGRHLMSGTSATLSPVSDAVVRIGPPYTVGGRTYVPADVPGLTQEGLASWYGPELEGRPTASGEPFRSDWMTAAHPTLPLPSYVSVTDLETGRSVLVRVNDRGPFVEGRVIDLSRGAARRLGLTGRHAARVRLERVEPSEADRRRLRSGRRALADSETPSTLREWPPTVSGVQSVRPDAVTAALAPLRAAGYDGATPAVAP